MFEIFLDTKVFGSAARAYSAIISTHTRIDALTEVAEDAFHRRNVDTEDQKKWTLLKGHYGDANGVRNDLVHGTAVHCEMDNPKRDFGWFWLPPSFNRSNTHAIWVVPIQDMKTPYVYQKFRYTSKEIDEFGLKFKELSDWVLEYMGFFQSKYPPLP